MTRKMRSTFFTLARGLALSKTFLHTAPRKALQEKGGVERWACSARANYEFSRALFIVFYSLVPSQGEGTRGFRRRNRRTFAAAARRR